MVTTLSINVKTFKYNCSLWLAMKKGLMILLIAVMLLAVVGCGFLPAKPGIEDAEEPVPEEPVQEQAEPEPAEEEVTEQAPVEEAGIDVVQDITEEANMTEEKPEISGNLDLQDNLELCPHLAERFECNKYDLRRCDFETFVGKNDYYPDLLSCRSGYDYRGENPDHKYCLIQECRPLEKQNIVYAYGGPTAYAEYIYSVKNVEGGILTHYVLHKCGEEYNEFKTSFDCKVYKSELQNI
jgi:hypothetical protein